MATMTQRSTYALDPGTMHAIKALAQRWQTSQAEVIRRSVRRAAEAAANSTALTPVEVIAYYREHAPARSWRQTRALISGTRQARRDADRARVRRAASG